MSAQDRSQYKSTRSNNQFS